MVAASAILYLARLGLQQGKRLALSRWTDQVRRHSTQCYARIHRHSTVRICVWLPMTSVAWSPGSPS